MHQYLFYIKSYVSAKTKAQTIKITEKKTCSKGPESEKKKFGSGGD